MSANLLLLFGNGSKAIAPVAPIDFTTTGVKDIGIQNSTGYFSAFLLQIMCTEIAGFGSNPTVSVGTNAPDYDNIYSELPFDFFAGNLTNKFQNIEYSNGPSIAQGAAVKANVTVAAVATTYLANIILGGTII